MRIVAKKKKKKQQTLQPAPRPAPPPSGPPRFAVGDKVRVRAGVTDPDYPDFPLGGWAGVVEDFNPTPTETLYFIEWNEDTLEEAHPAYFRRCERDELEAEHSWLGEADLEPDTGEPVARQQPTTLVPRPLDLDHPDDLARHIFGLTRDDELPPVTRETMSRFHAYLRDRLTYPFPTLLIEGEPEDGNIRPVLVMRLLPLDLDQPFLALRAEVAVGPNETEEIPLFNLGAMPGSRESVALDAYRAWLAEAEDESPTLPLGPPNWKRLLLNFILVPTVLGGVAGALLQTSPGAWLAAQIGGCLLGLLGMLLGGGFEMTFRRGNRLPPGVIGGGLLGTLAGAAVGALLGTLVVSFVGTLLGAIAGTLLAQVLLWLGGRPRVVSLTALGALLGAVALAFWGDREKALGGLWPGLLVGGGGAVLFLLGAFGYAYGLGLYHRHDV